MTTSAVIRAMSDGLSSAGSASGTAGVAVLEWRTAQAVKRAFSKASHSIRAWQHRRQTMEALSMLSDRHLSDIGIMRADIPRIAAEMAERQETS